MPFDSAVLPLFVIASLVLLVTPGPDIAFIVATGVSEGRRAAIWASVGIALSMFVHSVCAAAGISAFVAASPLAFDVIRYVGAGYLLYLGYEAIRGRTFPLSSPPTSRSSFASLRRGFLTNLLNPKALLFFGLFLPQFASVEYG